MFKLNKDMGEVATTEEEIKNILGKANHGDIKRINGKNIMVLHAKSKKDMERLIFKMQIERQLAKRIYYLNFARNKR